MDAEVVEPFKDLWLGCLSAAILSLYPIFLLQTLTEHHKRSEQDHGSNLASHEGQVCAASVILLN